MYVNKNYYIKYSIENINQYKFQNNAHNKLNVLLNFTKVLPKLMIINLIQKVAYYRSSCIYYI